MEENKEEKTENPSIFKAKFSARKSISLVFHVMT